MGERRRAVSEKAYLHSDLRFLGVGVPKIREATIEMDRRHGVWTRAELRRVVDAAWSRPEHELRVVAIELLVRHVDLLSPADLPWLERLLRSSHTWAYIDALAVDVVGPVVERSRDADRLLERWSTDPDFWVRRSALLALLGPLRRGPARFDAFARLAGSMVTDTEFFIRKAIGWILRDVGKRRPELTYRFLRVHRRSVSGLTLREGARYLPLPMRRRLGLSGVGGRPDRRSRPG